MELLNSTGVKEFILLSFSDFQQYERMIFFTFILVTYIICVIGNIAIMTIVWRERSLHTPMYLYISLFSALEIMSVSSTVPKLLETLASARKNISFVSCFTQLYLFNSLGVTECYLLVVMVFDRHLAINNPLHYSAIMSNQFCTVLAIIPWAIGFAICLLPTIITARFRFCGPLEINHYFCDFAPLEDMACFIPLFVIVLSSFLGFIDVVVPFIIILGFYLHIIITVLHIKGGTGKRKAFSTCTSHLIVTSLFYGTATIVYVKPKGSQYNKFLALMYNVVTPLINPFIYSFRNRAVKEAFRKHASRLLTQQ